MRRDGEKVRMVEVVLKSQLSPCPYPTLVAFNSIHAKIVLTKMVGL